MDKSGINGEPGVARTLDRELELIRGAIALVASGRAPRVRLAGLRSGVELLELARRMAATAGVRLVSDCSSAEHLARLTVERVGDA
jgi:hypothetical protein